MIGAAEIGAGVLLRPGEVGPAEEVVDDGTLAPVPAGAPCWVVLPQAHSATVSATAVSAALTGIRFSMTAPACRETDAPWTQHLPCLVPLANQRLTRQVPHVPISSL